MSSYGRPQALVTIMIKKSLMVKTHLWGIELQRTDLQLHYKLAIIACCWSNRYIICVKEP